MSLIDKFKKGTKSEADPTAPKPEKKSLYRRYHDSKRREINDEDLKKYTGMTKAEISGPWSKGKEVGGNQLAGKTALGDASWTGWAGWGRSANEKPKYLPKASSEETPESKAMGSDDSLDKVEKK
jgi:hypothetical protein